MFVYFFVFCAFNSNIYARLEVVVTMKVAVFMHNVIYYFNNVLNYVYNEKVFLRITSCKNADTLL